MNNQILYKPNKIEIKGLTFLSKLYKMMLHQLSN